ncbi:MAG: methyltransferase domain-containing protein [Thaumarchaeota archaeon]|nr:methyltransferase domain-containing protein [Nitrososphaerota archaeon]
MPTQDFGRVADIYDATRSLPEDQMRALTGAIRDQVGPGNTLIDIGVGTGRFAKPLQESGLEVLGVDISRGMMAKAKEKRVQGLFLADVHHLPFQDKRFEASIMVHLLHLVADWQRVVKEAARVSRAMVLTVTGSTVGPSFEEDYLAIRTQLGYPLNRFEAGERGLQDRVPPAKLIRVGEVERDFSSDEEIASLLRREESLTWDLPEDVHQRVIAELRARHSGESFKTTSAIDLVVWTPEQLERRA